LQALGNLLLCERGRPVDLAHKPAEALCFADLGDVVVDSSGSLRILWLSRGAQTRALGADRAVETVNPAIDRVVSLPGVARLEIGHEAEAERVLPIEEVGVAPSDTREAEALGLDREDVLLQRAESLDHIPTVAGRKSERPLDAQHVAVHRAAHIAEVAKL